MPKIFDEETIVIIEGPGGDVIVPTEINLVNVQEDVAMIALEAGVILPDNQEDIAHTALESNITLPNNQTENALSELESNITLPNNRSANALESLESNINLPNSQTDIAKTQLESNINMPNSQVLTSFKVLGPPFWQSEANASGQTDVTSIVITKPSGVAVGDLMLIFIGVSNATAVGVNTLAGWTLIRTDAITIAGGGTQEAQVRSFYRIADGTEGSTFTFTFDATASEWGWQIHRVNGNHATTPIDANSGNTLLASALDPDPSAPAVTSVASNCLIFAYLFHSHLALSQTHTPPTSHEERVDNTGGGGSTRWGHTSATRVFATAGSQAAVEFNCTETVATDAIMQRISIAPGELQL